MSRGRLTQLAATGLAAGLFSGLFGVGGGVVAVPLLILWLGYGEREATGTSLLMITVTALVGQGGLGKLLIDGFQRDFQTPLTIGILLSLALALAADLMWIGVLRVATPWRRHAVA